MHRTLLTNTQVLRTFSSCHDGTTHLGRRTTAADKGRLGGMLHAAVARCRTAGIRSTCHLSGPAWILILSSAHSSRLSSLSQSSPLGHRQPKLCRPECQARRDDTSWCRRYCGRSVIDYADNLILELPTEIALAKPSQRLYDAFACYRRSTAQVRRCKLPSGSTMPPPKRGRRMQTGPRVVLEPRRDKNHPRENLSWSSHKLCVWWNIGDDVWGHHHSLPRAATNHFGQPLTTS